MPLGYRSSRVLAVFAAQPGASNREVANAAEVSDEGQISRLLARLQNLGLIHNPETGQKTPVARRGTRTASNAPPRTRPRNHIFQ